MKLSDELANAVRDTLSGLALVDRKTLLKVLAVLEAAEPRPWPPPEGVTRCLGWDKDNERWRVCIHEYGGWVFEDGLGPVRHWCPVWQPMPPEPEDTK
jgi:hypothetical protein